MTNEDRKLLRLIYYVACLTLGVLVGFIGSYANAAEPVRIGIMDTGYDEKIAPAKLKLCKTGHYDFAENKAQIGFIDPHGTVIGSIIAKELDGVEYCAVIYQVFDSEDSNKTLDNVTKAFKRAKKENLVAINASFEGNLHSFEEMRAIYAISPTLVFAAAGNQNHSLDDSCRMYPACYKLTNIIVVGALSPDYTQKAIYSNYGSLVTVWYPGHVKFQGVWQHGTSFAAPRALADFIRGLPK